jgi:DNA repair protein RadA
MSHVSDLQLEDLPGVESHLITKLKRAGIQSVLDLAVSIPHELALGANDGGGAVAADTETISEAVLKAKKILIDSGALIKEFSTADQVLERRKALVRFTTGSKNVDDFLKGGVESQAITELAGEFGSGKSQICHTLCVTAAANNNNGTKSPINSIIFIDTENTFRPERVQQIAEARDLDYEEIMKKVFVCKISNSAQLEALIRHLGKSIEEYKAKLVIVDSIISLHRAEYIGRETLADRQQRLNIMLHKLIRLAEVYNIAVVLTNQVQSSPDNAFSGGGNDSVRAAGGNIMAHACTYRIFLRKIGKDRLAIMVDSPHHAYDQVRFTIGEKGVENAQVKAAAVEGSESGW